MTEQEQADYLVEASQLMVERPWVGPFFIWNLNMSVTWGAERPESLFSLVKPDTAFRKAYIALRLLQPAVNILLTCKYCNCCININSIKTERFTVGPPARPHAQGA